MKCPDCGAALVALVRVAAVTPVGEAQLFIVPQDGTPRIFAQPGSSCASLRIFACGGMGSDSVTLEAFLAAWHATPQSSPSPLGVN